VRHAERGREFIERNNGRIPRGSRSLIVAYLFHILASCNHERLQKMKQISDLPLIAGLLLVAILCYPMRAHAQKATAEIASEAPKWCEFAAQYLKRPSGAAFACSPKSPRCIRMYSCAKNFSTHPYDGQLRTSAGVPITDVDHHALYEDPKWSLLRSIGLLRHYYNDLDKRTALTIAETWAPWCDTNGSKIVHSGWGRTCNDGPGKAPASFTGPRCMRPADGHPLKGQCGPCNCPNELATFYAKDSGKGVNDDLTLFDAGGNPTHALNNILKRVVWMELGLQPSSNLIEGAIAIYKP
jgi:hypothetical protein